MEPARPYILIVPLIAGGGCGGINLCVSDSYSRLTAQQTGGLPRAHLFVFQLHFTLTWAAGPGLCHCACVCVSFKNQAGVCFPLHLVESNLSPGRAHKSRWGMGMNSARVKREFDSFFFLLSLYLSLAGGSLFAFMSMFCSEYSLGSTQKKIRHWVFASNAVLVFLYGRLKRSIFKNLTI